MRLNDLGNFNLKAMLVSSFSNNVGAGPMPLEGAPHDLYMQLLAGSSSQSVFAVALLRACHFLCCVFFPNPPALSSGPSMYWLVSIPLNSSV